MTVGPATTAAPCTAHKTHQPHPTYCELHHVVPQAWQIAWQPHPGADPFAGPSPDRAGVTLWDARTVALCRTGHGNVHHWLVATMHEIDRLAQQTFTDPKQPLVEKDALKLALVAWAHVKATARQAHVPVAAADATTAQLAIDRYVLAGGDLQLLIAAGQWGQI